MCYGLCSEWRETVWVLGLFRVYLCLYTEFLSVMPARANHKIYMQSLVFSMGVGYFCVSAFSRCVVNGGARDVLPQARLLI